MFFFPSVYKKINQQKEKKEKENAGTKVTDKMVPLVQVSLLIKLGLYSGLGLSMAYGAKHYSYLKPRGRGGKVF